MSASGCSAAAGSPKKSPTDIPSASPMMICVDRPTPRPARGAPEPAGWRCGRHAALPRFAVSRRRNSRSQQDRDREPSVTSTTLIHANCETVSAKNVVPT